MAYRKSYYEQRVEEQARIREAVLKQIQHQQEEVEAAAVEPIVEVAEEEDAIVPDSSWTKTQIQVWLTEEGIEWASSMTKTQLLGLI